MSELTKDKHWKESNNVKTLILEHSYGGSKNGLFGSIPAVI